MEDCDLSVPDKPKKAPLVREKFTPAEDLLLKQLIMVYKIKKWSSIASFFPTKTARQCRDRWNNYINPELSNKKWSIAEDSLILQKVKELGLHWNNISKFFNGRPANSIRNRYKYLIRHMQLLQSQKSGQKNIVQQQENNNNNIISYEVDDFEPILIDTDTIDMDYIDNMDFYTTSNFF